MSAFLSGRTFPSTIQTSDIADDAITAAKLAAGAASKTINEQTGTTYTAVAGDAHNIVSMNNAASNIFTLPAHSSVPFTVGDQIEVQQYGAGSTNIELAGTINGQASPTAGTGAMTARYGVTILTNKGEDIWTASGDVGTFVVAHALFITSTFDEVNRTTYTFSSQSIGVATTDRKVVVCVTSSGGTSGTISSVTVGGDAMTENVKPAIDGETQCAIYEREVASGTAADIVVTHSGSKGACGIAVYTVTGAALTVTTTASTTTDNTPNTTINVSKNGTLICCSSACCGSNPISASWSGVTERSDDDTPGDNIVFTSASDDQAADETGRAIACTYNVTPSDTTMAACAWDSA